MPDGYYVGLISGTSVDAMDAVLVTFETGARAGVNLLATHSAPPPAGLRKTLLAANAPDHQLRFSDYGRLDQAVAQWAAEAARTVCDKAGIRLEDITAIGSHGQTVWHAPDESPGFSLQLGQGARIAAETNATVVSDFRSMDLALGGQGAPLVCACHGALFGQAEQARAVVNIGGIANVTRLAPGANHNVLKISGFDTGPGNGLMDEWIDGHQDIAFDANGAWAASGHIDQPLLDSLLAEPYFSRAAPKSTGRDWFNRAWLDAHLDRLDRGIEPVNVQATLAELTAITVARAIHDGESSVGTVYLCGGGAHNAYLVARIAAHVAPADVAVTDDLGVAGDWLEAIAFAWLARERLAGRPGNAPRVTGAMRPALLGAVYSVG